LTPAPEDELYPQEEYPPDGMFIMLIYIISLDTDENFTVEHVKKDFGVDLTESQSYVILIHL
jgi:hypothetical protein